jgi:hypothetical protein
MFAERCLQASGLMDFPDLGDGDLTQEQRREALRRAVNVHQPTAALSMFLAVVALEDLVRDFGARCADDSTVASYFPKIDRLRMIPIAPRPGNPFARLDKDPAPLTDFAGLNVIYRDVLGCEPFKQGSLARLYDLALVRHTVAHHGARVRAIDAPRFQHWAVRPNLAINPPREFVLQVVRFVQQVGTAYRMTIQNAVFQRVLPALPSGWVEHPPFELHGLLELFNYFDKLVSQEELPLAWHEPDPLERERIHAESLRSRLIDLCITELSTSLPFPVPVPDAV